MNLHCFKLLLASFLLASFSAIAQPVGANLSNPINVGNFPRAAFSDTRNNYPNNGYGNDIGQLSDDIFYKINVTTAGELEVSTCSSNFDTYIHILDANGNTIASNDDSEGCSNYYQAFLRINVIPGIYYVVTEGWYNRTGDINVTINLTRNGALARLPIDAGNLLPGNAFTDIKSNSPAEYFYNNYGQISDDIYYTFSLANPGKVNISHCASGFDTYLHLLDVNMNSIASNDDYGDLCNGYTASLSVDLPAGTYYVVSEGWNNRNGNITTSISIPSTFLSSPLSFQETNDAIIENLDPNQIPTQILYDRVFPLASLHTFTGQSNADTSTSEHFLKAYEEIYQSNFQNQSMLQPEALKNQLNQESSNPLGVLIYDYNTVDSNAVQNNQFYAINGKLYDVPNRTTSPYITKTAVVASFLSRFGQVGVTTFSFPQTYTYTNKNVTINSIQADFDDGAGTRNISPGSTITINYNTSGEKVVKLNLNLSTGASVAANAIFPVIEPVNQALQSSVPSATCTAIDSVTFEGYEYDASAYGEGTSKGEIKAYYYYADGNCAEKKIRKPVIFLDGFDPSNARGHKEIWTQFINTLDFPLGDKFRNEGYDMIILDYKDGGDFIEKNALAVVKALEGIYSQHSSTITEDFVVIGPSMGAPIARYALAWAEQHNKNLHVRTYISFDGVHQGANIPIGLQSLVGMIAKTKYASNISDPKKNPLICNAAKQMLVHHYLAESATPVPHNYFNIFQQHLASIGYPNNCRKVAIINGSYYQIQQDVNPGQMALGLRLNAPWPFGDYLRLKMFHAPSTGRSDVYQYFLTNGLAKLAGVPRTWTEQAEPYINGYSYDQIPGGTSNTYEQIDNAIRGGLDQYYGGATYRAEPVDIFNQTFYVIIPIRRRDINITRNSPGHSFVPSTSAADIQSNSSPRLMYYNWSNENITCSGSSPFDRVYAPANNEGHVKINAQNSVWFENEVKGNGTAQPEGNYDINGDPSFSGWTLFNLHDLPSTYNVSWAVDGNFSINGTNTGKEIEIMTTGNCGDTGILTGHVTNQCGTSFDVTRLLVNNDSAPWNAEISGPSSTNVSNQWFQLTAGHPNAVSYEWTVSPASATVYPLSDGLSADVIFNEFGAHNVTCTAYLSSTCETISSITKYVDYQPNYSYSFSPNPTSYELQVLQIDGSHSTVEAQSTKKVKPFDIKLFDKEGKVLRSAKSDSKQSFISLDARSIPDGMYFLHIKEEGKDVIMRQVIVKHQ